MKKLVFSLIVSFALIFTSVASAYSGVNLPDEKKKKSCCKSDNKECKEGKKEECKKGEKKDCCKEGKKSKKSCDTESKESK
jgi:hypothetical protein